MAACNDSKLKQLDVELGDIPMMSGCSTTLWQIGTNIMSTKKVDGFTVTNLRTILLYDAEFNRLEVAGQATNDTGKNMNALTPEPYGSHSGLAAIYQSLNMQLSLDPAKETFHCYLLK